MAVKSLRASSRCLAMLLSIFMAAELVSTVSVGVKQRDYEKAVSFTRNTQVRNVKKPEIGHPVISDNSTILSTNKTFELGFFTADGGSNWYIGIWYASIPIRTYIWVANRENPVKGNKSSPREMRFTDDGQLSISDSAGVSVWRTGNTESAASARLMENGNLVLLSSEEVPVWQSFEFPTDTWLPEMKISRHHVLTCWRSPSDPAPGNYSLRLKPLDYGEFELIYNGSIPYWTTGTWTGDSFVAVPEMTVPYIYTFNFTNPFTPEASFAYAESTTNGRALTRFAVEPTGLLKQYVWSAQSDYWNMFWYRPESACRVYALCGNFGLCGPTRDHAPCECPQGYTPVDVAVWRAGGYSSGCRQEYSRSCLDDRFESVGVVVFTADRSKSFSAISRSSCEEVCLKNCSCVGFVHNEKQRSCRNLYDQILNLKNMTVDRASDHQTGVLHLRVGKHQGSESRKKKKVVLVVCLAVTLTVLTLVFLALAAWKIRREKQRKEAGRNQAGDCDAMQLQIYSLKELQSATCAFSRKIGHGGFGTVFLGEFPGGKQVAVKRLERRDGAGEREFSAEVRTIGSVHHVNLVRLRGFCCERTERILVYDYMPNGPLSAYLGPSGPCLSWAARFRIAVGTARAIAYLHEECRDCIIHCDIKPENILLDSDGGAKISDFGMAKLVGRDFSRVLATMRGTRGYVAPEWISGTAITAKADVYSYGMTLLELIGGRRNVVGGPDGSPAGDKWFFPPWAARDIIEGRVDRVVDERLREEYDPAQATRACLVAVWCIQDGEAARPTMRTAVKMLEGAVAVGVPPAPQLLQALVAEESCMGRESRSTGSPNKPESSTGPANRVS